MCYRSLFKQYCLAASNLQIALTACLHGNSLSSGSPVINVYEWLKHPWDHSQGKQWSLHWAGLAKLQSNIYMALVFAIIYTMFNVLLLLSILLLLQLWFLLFLVFFNFVSTSFYSFFNNIGQHWKDQLFGFFYIFMFVLWFGVVCLLLLLLFVCVCVCVWGGYIWVLLQCWS